MTERKDYSIQPNSQILKFTSHQICIICDGNEVKPELGTGFLFLRADWIVTAAHVIQVDGIVRTKLYGKLLSQEQTIINLEVVAIHKENDIALLRILNSPNPCTQPLYPGYDELSTSKGLITCGYTPSKGNVITIARTELYSKDFRHRTDTEIVLEFETNDIEGGSSGDPIFGDGGVVLGILINLFTIEEEQGKTFARATSIQNLMKSINISYNPDILNTIQR